MNQKPNIILIMTDDQGYGDLGYMGSAFVKTPHIDALAENGIKFSLFDGGIRVPAFICGGSLPKVNDNAHCATDIFPTVLEACGGRPEDYETDGISILEELQGGRERTHDYLFWEMEQQTAVRHGRYKLVINGQLTEGEEKRAELFLSDIINDPAETENLCERYPELAAELKQKALTWRESIEKTWEERFAKNYRLT